MVEVKVLLSELLRKYVVQLPEDADASDMEPVFAVVIRPRANRCNIILRRISQV